MATAQDPYRTSFENILKCGLHAYGLSFVDLDQKEGNILLDEYIPVLISNTDYSKGQFKIIRERKVMNEQFNLIHLLAVQGLNSCTDARDILYRNALYEILSLWLPLSVDIRALPNFELSACVDNWYIDSLEIHKGRQKYEPRRMTGRVLKALQLYEGINLPDFEMADLIELD